MIYEKQPFSPTDYKELMDPHYSTSKVTLNDENVFAYLEAQGYDLSLLENATITNNALLILKKLGF